MTPPKIPEPTKRTAELIAKLGRALELFQGTKARRDEAKQRADAARFRVGDLERNAPRSLSDVRSQATHEKSLRDARSALNEATTVFLELDGEVGKTAADVWSLHGELCAAARLELEPVQRGAMKAVETALDSLLSAIEVACAVNRILGTGAPSVYPRVPSPLNMSHDLAYRRPTAQPDIAQAWLKLQKLRSGAMDAGSETPLQAAE